MFRVVNKNNTVVFGPNDNSAKDWKNWQLRLEPISNPNGFNLQYSNQEGLFDNLGSYQTAKCPNEKRQIEHLEISSRQEFTVKMTDPEFKFKTDTCNKWFNRIECKIHISANKHMKWKQSFEPKIIFSAF